MRVSHVDLYISFPIHLLGRGIQLVIPTPSPSIARDVRNCPFAVALPHSLRPIKANHGLISLACVWQTDLHPSILTLGLLYANGTIRGTNARTVAMLTAFAEVRPFPSQNCTRRGAVGRGNTKEGASQDSTHACLCPPLSATS
jgi:hypothetical protein